VVALFEHGEHGWLAASIVRDVMKAYFDKKVRITTLRQQQVAMEKRGLGIGGWGLGIGRPRSAALSAPATIEAAYFETTAPTQPQPPTPNP